MTPHQPDGAQRTARSVGIMTMHRIRNYGSTLQAYGLRRLVESVAPEATVSFLDFRPGPVLAPDAHRPTSGLGRSLAKVREYARTKAPLSDRARFLNHKRMYGRRYFPLVGIPSQPLHDLRVDVEIIGSDEVFNCVQGNSNVGYSRDLFGHGSPAAKVVTYAASFGNTTAAKIASAGIADHVSADLRRLAHLSVRDEHSRNLVESLTGRSPEVHVDPALAYPFMSLERRIPRHRLHADPYLIVYGYSGRLTAGENAQIRAYADRRGASILAFGGVQECADRFIDCSPFELLAYFRDALGIITDTFHGSIFSIINKKPFGTIVRRSSGNGYGNEEKLDHLLRLFGLDERRMDGAGKLHELLDADVDASRVDEVLTRERDRTRAYLSKVVNQCT